MCIRHHNRTSSISPTPQHPLLVPMEEQFVLILTKVHPVIFPIKEYPTLGPIPKYYVLFPIAQSRALVLTPEYLVLVSVLIPITEHSVSSL